VAGPEQILKLLRQRWGIENGLHWRRDVLFQADSSPLKIGSAPQVNAVLNNLAVGLLRLAGKSNLAKARRELAFEGATAIRFLSSAYLSTLSTLQ
jgi:predicted transposase YbfD/YdcC